MQWPSHNSTVSEGATASSTLNQHTATTKSTTTKTEAQLESSPSQSTASVTTMTPVAPDPETAGTTFTIPFENLNSSDDLLEPLLSDLNSTIEDANEDRHAL